MCVICWVPGVEVMIMERSSINIDAYNKKKRHVQSNTNYWAAIMGLHREPTTTTDPASPRNTAFSLSSIQQAALQQRWRARRNRVFCSPPTSPPAAPAAPAHQSTTTHAPEPSPIQRRGRRTSRRHRSSSGRRQLRVAGYATRKRAGCHRPRGTNYSLSRP